MLARGLQFSLTSWAGWLTESCHLTKMADMNPGRRISAASITDIIVDPSARAWLLRTAVFTQPTIEARVPHEWNWGPYSTTASLQAPASINMWCEPGSP